MDLSDSDDDHSIPGISRLSAATLQSIKAYDGPIILDIADMVDTDLLPSKKTNKRAIRNPYFVPDSKPFIRKPALMRSTIPPKPPPPELQHIELAIGNVMSKSDLPPPHPHVIKKKVDVGYVTTGKVLPLTDANLQVRPDIVYRGNAPKYLRAFSSTPYSMIEKSTISAVDHGAEWKVAPLVVEGAKAPIVGFEVGNRSVENPSSMVPGRMKRSRSLDELVSKVESEDLGVDIENLYRRMYAGLHNNSPKFSLAPIDKESDGPVILRHASRLTANEALIATPVVSTLKSEAIAEEVSEKMVEIREYRNIRRATISAKEAVKRSSMLSTQSSSKKWINPHDIGGVESLPPQERHAVALIKENKLGEARAVIESELQINPVCEWAVWNRYILNIGEERHEDALKDINTLVMLNPSDPGIEMIRRKLSTSDSNVNDLSFNSASSNFGVKQDEQGTDSEIVRSAKISATHAATDQNANLYIQRGITDSHSRLWREALNDLSQAVAADFSCEVAFELRSSLLRRKNPAKAVDDYTAAMVLNKTFPNSHNQKHVQMLFYRGSCYFEMGKYHCARTDFESALKLDPCNQVVLKNLAYMYFKIFGEFEHALDLASRLHMLYPDDDRILILHSQIHLKLAKPRKFLMSERDHYDAAIENLSMYLRNNSTSSDGYMLRGRCYWLMGEKSKFRNDLTAAAEKLQGEHAVYRKALIKMLINDPVGCRNLLLSEKVTLSDNLTLLLAKTYRLAGEYGKSLELSRHVASYHPERDFNYGVSLFFLKKTREAILPLQRSLPFDKFNLECQLRIAQCQLQLGINEALTNLKSIANMNSSGISIQAKLSLALLFEAKGLSAKAESIYDNVIMQCRYSKRAYMLRGILRFRKGHYDDAIQDFAQIKQCNGDTYVKLLYYLGIANHKLGNYDAAIILLSSLILHGAYIPLAYQNRALVYWARGQRELACYDLLDALPFYSSSENFVILLAHALSSIGKYEKSVQVLEEFLHKHRERAEVLVLLGDHLLHLHRHHEARQRFAAAIRLKPKVFSVYLKYSSACRLAGDLKNALSVINRALKRFPKIADIYTAKGELFLLQKHYRPALLAFNAAIDLDNHHGEALVNRGLIYQILGSSNYAIADYKACLRCDPQNRSALYNSASLYLAHNQLELALRLFDEFLALNDDALGRLNRAIAKSLLNDLAGAEVDFIAASQLDPFNYDCMLHLARFMDCTGQYEPAVEAYRRCNSLNPKEKDTHDAAISLLIVKHDRNEQASYDAKIHLIRKSFAK